MSKPPAPRCLCIVSGDPVRSAELLAALRTMVSTHERLEIIVDRRRGKSGSGTNPPSADRRRQPSVDVKVKMDGFAIVPYPPPALAGRPLDDETDPAAPEFARVLEFKAALASWSLDNEADPAAPEFARVLEFNQRLKARRRRRLALTLLVGSTLAVLLLALVPTMKALMSPTRLAAPPPAESLSAIAMSSPLPPTDASPQPGGSLRSPEPTPPAVERTGRPRAKPAGSPPMRRTNEPVHAAPAPMAVESPAVASPPAEGAGGARACGASGDSRRGCRAASSERRVDTTCRLSAKSRARAVARSRSHRPSADRHDPRCVARIVRRRAIGPERRWPP